MVKSILLFVIVIFSSFQSTPKQTDSIVLVDERLPIIPKEFYIAKVTDQRTDKNPVALLFPTTNVKGVQPKLTLLTCKAEPCLL
jgi:hypothetical protein